MTLSFLVKIAIIVIGREVCPVRTFCEQGGKGFFKCVRLHWCKTLRNLRYIYTNRGRGFGTAEIFRTRV